MDRSDTCKLKALAITRTLGEEVLAYVSLICKLTGLQLAIKRDAISDTRKIDSLHQLGCCRQWRWCYATWLYRWSESTNGASSPGLYATVLITLS